MEGDPLFTMSVNLSYRQLDEDGLFLLSDTLRAELLPESLSWEMTESLSSTTPRPMSCSTSGAWRRAADDSVRATVVGRVEDVACRHREIDRGSSVISDEHVRCHVQLWWNCATPWASACASRRGDQRRIRSGGRHGSDYIQGFLFGRPLPEEEFERRFLEGRA
ncbi:MAG: hypothetical protein ACLTMP_00260 [Eggerthella lenta]